MKYCLYIFKIIKYYDNIFIFHYSFSTTQAAPIPVPMHMLITPYFYFYLLSSGNKEAIYLAPVHPRGCPKAIAPPLGLTFDL